MRRGSRTWPDDWEQRRAGEVCWLCAEGRPDVDVNGNVRFYVGEVSDGYLQRRAPQHGYATVIWRGRHVPDPSDMTDTELGKYWSEVSTVARALVDVFEPCHLNYDILGNEWPHVHAHIVSRFIDDPCPGTPLKPWELHAFDEREYASHVDALRQALAP